MIKPSCSKARRLVLESEGGSIESADALWLESHIQECASCREESRELARLFGAWKALDPPRLSASRLERIERAVLEAGAAPATKRRVQRTWKVPTIAAGVAATLAVVSLAVFWSKRQPANPASQPPSRVVAPVAPPPQTASVTQGTVHVYGPTGDARVYGRGMSAPWNASLHTPAHTGGVVALGAHATLGLAARSQIALGHHGSDTIIALTRGAIALDVNNPGTQRTGRIRVWIPGRGEVATKSARLVVIRNSAGVAVSTRRGWARYRWSQSGAPQDADLEAGELLTHRLDTVRRGIGSPAMDAESLLAGRPPKTQRRAPGVAPQRQRPSVAQAQPVGCASKQIQQTLARRDAMGALRTLEACRAAGRSSQDLRALEARANLQAGRVRRAFNQYLAVAHSYRGSAAGQTALFSAGRIALRRLARKSQAKRLFQHYLATYPKGAHRANVQQLLRTL